jgi:hypothetical protein
MSTVRYFAYGSNMQSEHGLPQSYVDWLRTVPTGTPTRSRSRSRRGSTKHSACFAPRLG